jgi:hypothetical protein
MSMVSSEGGGGGGGGEREDGEMESWMERVPEQETEGRMSWHRMRYSSYGVSYRHPSSYDVC